MSIEHGAWMYDRARELSRMTPGELAEVSARHHAAGYTAAAARAMLAIGGAISTCEPRERPSGEWVRCECGAVMLAQHLVEHMARATVAAEQEAAAAAGEVVTEKRVWSLHRVLLAGRAAR